MKFQFPKPNPPRVIPEVMFDKIQAIKFFNVATGVTLMNAKHYMDANFVGYDKIRGLDLADMIRQYYEDGVPN